MKFSIEVYDVMAVVSASFVRQLDPYLDTAVKDLIAIFVSFMDSTGWRLRIMENDWPRRVAR